MEMCFPTVAGLIRNASIREIRPPTAGPPPAALRRVPPLRDAPRAEHPHLSAGTGGRGVLCLFLFAPVRWTRFSPTCSAKTQRVSPLSQRLEKLPILAEGTEGKAPKSRSWCV